jgi:hypothetical protein
MGEKFVANPVTGTGSMLVFIAISPGRLGFGLQLSLSCDSGAGNGPFGFGWSLSLPSVTCKTDKGLPQYFDADESDVFILSGAEFMDLASDGYPDIVVMEDPTPGFYEHDDAEGWQPFRPFTSRLGHEYMANQRGAPTCSNKWNRLCFSSLLECGTC